MTASCAVTAGSTAESTEIDLLATASETEASATTDAEVSVPDCCQMAILRSMSDACLSLLNQSGSVFSQFSPQNKPAPSETLLAKNGMLMKSSSLPNLSSQKSLDTFSSTDRNPSLQQARLYSSFTSTKEEKTPSSSVFFSVQLLKTQVS